MESGQVTARVAASGGGGGRPVADGPAGGDDATALESRAHRPSSPEAAAAAAMGTTADVVEDWNGHTVTVEMMPDEVWAVIGSFLDVKGLGRLACTNTRFNEKTVSDPDFDGPRAEAPRWSLVDEAARLAIVRATSLEGQSSNSPVAADETWLQYYSVLLLPEYKFVTEKTKLIRQIDRWLEEAAKQMPPVAEVAPLASIRSVNWGGSFVCDAKVVDIRAAPECSLLHQIHIEWHGKWAGHGKTGGKEWIDSADIGECAIARGTARRLRSCYICACA